jgi:DNA-binding Lrp family transcriptional regulator
MTIGTIPQGRQLALYLRSLGAHGSSRVQEIVVERLERLEREGVIEGFETHVWGDQLALGGALARTDAGVALGTTVDDIHAWAADTEVDLVGFERRVLASAITDEHHEVVVLPALALVEYEGDELVHVSPCRKPEGCLTVGERLAELERASGVEPPGSGRDSPEREPEAPGRTRTV